MIVVDNDRVVCFDVDDTLVFWSQPKKDAEMIYVDGTGLWVNQYIVDQMKKYKTMGYVIVVWSQAGKDWAREVIFRLDISHLVDYVFTKPTYYYDDLKAKHWMKHMDVTPPE